VVSRPVKVIIQIPCFNEAETLPATIADLPRRLKGVDIVEWLVIDDGSTDGTEEIARRFGVDHVVRHHYNKGLAAAFMTGVHACIRRGATIIVNTDADNQYSASSIPALIEPILSGRADIVIGNRKTSSIKHFSPVKRMLQWLGSSVVRYASGTSVPDAPSGFRAMHVAAAERLNVFNEYTYTLETIIQAGQSNMRVTSVDVATNGPTRQSRLVKNIASYVYRSIVTILAIFTVYRPLRAFLVLGGFAVVPGVLLGVRYLYLLWIGEGEGNTQSLILAAILVLVGFMTWVTGVVAELIAINRKLLQELRTRVIRVEQCLVDDDRGTVVVNVDPAVARRHAQEADTA
jgi:glycosyltransferase involved in cell wall biosynthesis